MSRRGPQTPRPVDARTAAARPGDSRRAEPRRAREPAIYRGANTPITSAERAPVHVEGRVYIRWRYVSGVIVLAMLILLGIFFISDAYYVHNVAIVGRETMTDAEVYALARIADTHVFWVDPAQVRRSLLESPSIADAQVAVTWNNPMVIITLQEREPALVWEQNGVITWIDVQGRVMEQRGERPELLRVVAEDASLADGETPLPIEQIEADIVNGALQLRELLPERRELRFTTVLGLGFVDPGGWEAWFGTGTDMPEKVLIYNAIIANLQGRSIQPGVVNLTNPDAPFYTARAGR
ncbi:MAG: FtsQ-type POTRA domain-containing protein [bacterium]|nr:FtsQ-type POTRA domain-containing protein [bacterium]